MDEAGGSGGGGDRFVVAAAGVGDADGDRLVALDVSVVGTNREGGAACAARTRRDGDGLAVGQRDDEVAAGDGVVDGRGVDDGAAFGHVGRGGGQPDGGDIGVVQRRAPD